MLSKNDVHDLIVKMGLALSTVSTDSYLFSDHSFTVRIGDGAPAHASRPRLAAFVALAKKGLFGGMPLLGSRPEGEGHQALHRLARGEKLPRELESGAYAVSSEMWDGVELGLHTASATTTIAGICQDLLMELTSRALRDEDVRPTLVRIASMQGLVERLDALMGEQSSRASAFVLHHDLIVAPYWRGKPSEIVAQIKEFLAEHLGQPCKVSVDRAKARIRVTPVGRPAIDLDYDSDWLAVDPHAEDGPEIVVLPSYPHGSRSYPNPSRGRTS